MLQAFTRSGAWLLSLLTVTLLLLSPAADNSAQAATDDTPTTFINDDRIEAWSVGAGQVYWANNCFGDEFNPIAELRRKAVGGGNIQIIETVNSDTQPDKSCLTYSYQESTGDGLYYYEEDSDPVAYRIMRMPLGAPFNPVVVKTLTANEAPNNGRSFVADGDYLYWPVNFTNKIFRTLKDGSGPIETVADTEPGPLDLIVVGTTVYWTDSIGVWGKRIDCDELPCGGTAKYDDFPTNAFAYGLTYRPFSGIGPFGGGFTLYWVLRTGSSPDVNYKIVYRSCNFNTVCFLETAPENPGDPVPEPPDPAVFHATSVNRVIGDLALVDDNIFWTENDGGTGFVFRKPYNAPLETPAGEIGTNIPNIGQQIYAANNLIFFARHGAGGGILTLPLNATVVMRDFNLEAMEVTQGIQNLANQTKLVGEKTTYVRAYATQIAGPSASNVEIQLIGTRNDLALPGSPLKPINGVRPLMTGGSYDRAYLNDGWYFLLPPSWVTAGDTQLQLVVDPRRLHNDPNLANNVYPADGSLTMTFQNQPPVCVWTVPVRTHTPLPSVYDPNFNIMASNFDRRWPVPETWIYRDTEPVEEFEFCSWYGVPYPCFGPYELSDGWGLTNGIPDRDKVIASLWTRALLSFNPDACDDIGAPVHFMGLVHPDADNGGAAGYASTVSNQSWVQLPAHDPITNAWDDMEEGSTMAQELAHNQGRKHVNCGGPDNIDSGYPYPPCDIANAGADSYYGFDIATRRPIRPTAAADFMSYANTTWVSDYTWNALIDKFATTNVAAATSPLATTQGEQVFVTGMVDGENERGEITLVLVLPGETLPPATLEMLTVRAAGVQHGSEPHVAYKLRLLGPEGEQVIPDRTLTLMPMDDHTDESEAHLFTDLFPKPTEPVAKIQLVADSTAVFTIEAGLSEPVVTIQQPTAGAVIENELTIQWTASDPDPNDRLKFTVQYSYNNGASWHTLAINLPSTPDPINTLTLTDLGSLQGSAPNAAKIRVLASDGFNTTIATSQGFTVENRPPQPIISAPVNGQSLPGGEAIVAQGTATDPEDGGLDGSALQWHVDGVDYGSGTAVAVEGLASMTHTVALAATDANSQTVTTTASFNLAPLSIPLVAAVPTLDGMCSDESYTQGIGLLPSAYGDDTAGNVRILRSADYLWVCFANLKLGAAAPGAYAGLRVDINNSREANAQATDYGFFVGENGDVFARMGNGAGDFVAPGPTGFEGQVTVEASSWNAELRIEKETLGGWDHLVNLAVGHHSLTAEDDDYVWPHPSLWGKPSTWSMAALGVQPLLNLISPSSAPILGSSFTLTVEGSSFVSGTQVLWNGEVLPTTFITTEVLTAQVASAKLTPAGVVQIATRSPAPGSFTSNALPFLVEAAAPNITSVSPGNAKAGSGPLTLTINGSNFVQGATVLWNGNELTAQFVNASQVKVVIDATLLQTGQEAGIAVSNPDPDSQISPVFDFQVLPTSQIFIPGLYRQP